MPILPMHVRRLVSALRAVWLGAIDPPTRQLHAWMERGFHCTPQQLERMQIERVAELVKHFAAAGLEKYQGIGTLTGYEQLALVPEMQRRELQELYPRLKEAFRSKRTFTERTTGTMGIPVNTLHTRSEQRIREAHKHYIQRMAGAPPEMTLVALWASPRSLGVDASSEGRLAQFVYPREIFNGFNPDAAEYRRMRDSILRNPGCLVAGYAGALTECAVSLSAAGLAIPAGTVGAMWTGAEALTPNIRSALRAGFGIEPREMYGCREAHWISMECLEGTRHISPMVLVETVDPMTRAPLPRGALGDLLLTDLFGWTTPVIRYAIGDAGSFEWAECACGKHGYVIKELHGRRMQMIRLPGGNNVSTFSYERVMWFYQQIPQYQLVREGENELRLLYTGAKLPHGLESEIVGRLAGVLPGASLGITHVEHIPKTAGGKFRFYRDEVEEREQAAVGP